MQDRISMKCNIPDTVLHEITSFAQKHKIRRIILFGSRSKGNNTQRSDIDIAVSGGDVDSFYWDIKEKAHTLLTFDIVDMDKGISEELKKEIEKYGVTIYEKI